LSLKIKDVPEYLRGHGSDFVSKAIVGFLTERLRNFRSSCVKLTNFAVLGGKFAKFSIRQS
jgi:hypothetical protein